MLEGRAKLVVAALALALAGGTAYYLHAQKQKRDQQRVVAALVSDTTASLRKALAGPPPPELVAHLDGNLKAAKAPRDRELENAAEDYIHGAREIVRRRGDAERLLREAAMSRRALAMHMAAASRRDSYWIRVATDLKKRAERDHFDLETSLKALSSLLGSLPDAGKRLSPYLDASLLLEEQASAQARAQAEATAKRAAEELEKVRRLAMPR
jgi:hypothetical protein